MAPQLCGARDGWHGHPTGMALSVLRVWAAKSVTEAVRIRSSLRGIGMSLEYTDAVAAEREMLAYQPTTRR